jgi:hypothetical protein
MKTIFKYPISIKPGRQTLRMPQVSNFLSFQIQGGKPCLWVEVNTDYIDVDIEIEIIPTGVKMENEGIYKGTIVDENLEVWHLYQIFDK